MGKKKEEKEKTEKKEREGKEKKEKERKESPPPRVKAKLPEWKLPSGAQKRRWKEREERAFRENLEAARKKKKGRAKGWVSGKARQNRHVRVQIQRDEEEEK